MSLFKAAERKQAKLKLLISGPSGSGKTYTSLLIAKAFGKKIAFLDTENGSASLYSGNKGIPAFDVIDVAAPYTINKYTDAINAAVAEKYDVLILDSLTHAWAGKGGLLEQKEAIDKAGRGNSYTNWATISKQDEAFRAGILAAPIHMICAVRSKQDYMLVDDGKGKQVPKKVGLAPIQREGMEYEFTVVFDLAMNHVAEVSKDRTGLFDGRQFIPDEETGKLLLGWLSAGVAPAHTTGSVAINTPPASPGDYRIMFGKTYNGMKLNEIPREGLIAALNGLDREYQSSGKSIPPIVQECFDYADRYLNPGAYK